MPAFAQETETSHCFRVHFFAWSLCDWHRAVAGETSPWAGFRAEKIANEVSLLPSHTRVSYFGMMPVPQDIDIMHRLKAAWVSLPASTYDAQGAWHGNPFVDDLYRT